MAGRLRALAIASAALALAACGEDSRLPAAPGVPGPATPSTIAALTLALSSVPSGQPVEATITLDAAAPAGGTSTVLSSTNAAAMVPESLTIPAGATTATFTVVTSRVAAPADVVIAATAGGVTRTAPLRLLVVPTGGPLAGLTARHDDVIGGSDTSGTITLAAPAPRGGTRVTLSSSDSDLTVPSSVMVLEGARTATFRIVTAAVSVRKDVLITATLAAMRAANVTTTDHAGTAATALTMSIRLLPAAPPPPTDSTPPPAPTLTGISPTTGGRGTTVPVTLTGTSFLPDATVAIGGAGVTVSDIIVVSATTITATFEVDAGAAIGARTVTVTTADGSTDGLTFVVTNTAPVADDDSYSTDEDVALIVPAGTGVLFNDSDADGNTLTAVLASEPSHGALALNADGSFIYTPDADYAGSDSFTYYASDGVADSHTATVSITVAHLFDDAMTFGFTEGPQDFTVPAYMTTLEIEATGARGGLAGPAGRGGRITARIAVTAGEVLRVVVGGMGGDFTSGSGGYNGGGASVLQEFRGGGGGGASDVRRTPYALSDRLVVAGGGGGGGGFDLYLQDAGRGGAGGGLAGAAGSSPGVTLTGGGGEGGGQSGGGVGGAAGEALGNPSTGGMAGSAGLGGAGGTGGDRMSGGGGGGGYYGGGGGGGGGSCGGCGVGGGGGGGGGSSFAGGVIVTNEQGVGTGHGTVIIRW